MATSHARREKRAALFGSGYGKGLPGARPATGQTPSVNPFMLPKISGLTQTSQMYPSNYYVDWDLSTWRSACDQVMKQGVTVSYAALTSWAYECSPFIQSIFNSMGDAIMAVPTFLVDEKGNKNEEWTKEICSTRWFQELKQEILFSYFWGFTGINFDPIRGKVYKYPMQQIDPINRALRESTFNYTKVREFDKYNDLLFVQPSTSYERFLGWMQPITREFIQMNLACMNWVQAGKRLAFPFLIVSYPEIAGEVNPNGEYIINPLKIDAENYAANIDPSKSLVTPYTIGTDGKPQLGIMVETKDTSSKQNTHKIYEDFNEDKKNDIRELVFGGTLTSNAGKYGTKALGETHEHKLKKAIAAKNEFILAVLNDKDDFLRKIKNFYRNMPDLHFDTNRAKVYDISEIEILSKAVALNGNRLTASFFINHGVLPEDIEEVPQEQVSQKPAEQKETKENKKTSFEALKKKYQ